MIVLVASNDSIQEGFLMSDNSLCLSSASNQAAWDAFCEQFLMEVSPEPDIVSMEVVSDPVSLE